MDTSSEPAVVDEESAVSEETTAPVNLQLLTRNRLFQRRPLLPMIARPSLDKEGEKGQTYIHKGITCNRVFSQL
jgi:hypothetical protein